MNIKQRLAQLHQGCEFNCFGIVYGYSQIKKSYYIECDNNINYFNKESVLFKDMITAINCHYCY